MKWKILVLIVACTVLLIGCEEEKPPEIPLVTGVEITCRHGEQTIQRTYTKPEKVQRFLYYLRRQQTMGYTDRNPERIAGDAAWIEVKLSDGQSRVYRQRADRFWSKDCQRWKKIDEAWGRRLYRMLILIPSDPVANPPAS